MKIEFSKEESEWLYTGIPINSTTMSRAVPHIKLRELFDCRKALFEIDVSCIPASKHNELRILFEKIIAPFRGS